MIKSKRYIWGGLSDEGYHREINEDAVYCKDITENIALLIIADGMGSLPSGVQPAQIAVNEIEQAVTRYMEESEQMATDNASFMLKEAMITANRVIGAFTLAYKEKYAGFGASVSCCLLYGGKFSMAHSGNTRVYLIRKHPKDSSPMMNQLTIDHTKARDYLSEGIINEEQYHIHPDRLVLTSGLGRFAYPEIQTLDGKLKDGDILLMTTDGIHYCLTPAPILQIVMESASADMAVSGLVLASKSQQYVDNMSAVMAYVLPEGK